jgi:TolA-binding protein
VARISRRELKHDEFVEKTIGATHWLEQHWRTALLAVGGLIFAVLLVVAWVTWSRGRADEARDEFGEGLRAYSKAESAAFADSAALEQARVTFAAVAENQGSDPPGPAARYYHGVTLHHMGRSDEAAAELGRAASLADTPTLAATALVMQAEVLAQSGKVDEAAAILERLVAGENAVYPPSEALLRLGWIHADSGDQERARETWQKLLDQYPDSPAARQVTEILGPTQNEAAAPAAR